MALGVDLVAHRDEPQRVVAQGDVLVADRASTAGAGDGVAVVVEGTKTMRECVVRSSSPVAGSPDRTWTLMCMLDVPVSSSRASTSTRWPIRSGR